MIIAGVALGITAVNEAMSGPVNDVHKRWGISIFCLYIAQAVFGTVIHFVKPKSWRTGGRRPFQNYFHPVVGLLLIAFAMFQVRLQLSLDDATVLTILLTGADGLPDGVACTDREGPYHQQRQYLLVFLDCGESVLL